MKNTVLWILQIVLAGLAKITLPRECLRSTLGQWVDAFPTPALELLGIAEVAAAVGLTVPPRVGVAPALTRLAAAGVLAVMAGAIITHGRRREYSSVAVNVVLAVAAGIVVWGRVGPYAF